MLSQRSTKYPSYISNTLKQVGSGHFQQSLFPLYLTDFYWGPPSPDCNFAIKKIMIVIIMSTIVILGVVLHAYIFKGTIGCKIHFYMVFAYKCVLEVCGHNYPTMIKISSHLFFLIPPKKPFWFSEQYDVILLKPRPRPLMDCPVLAYFRTQQC